MTDELLTPLEMAVLAETCKQLSGQERTALQKQIDGISVRKRENSGAGFFTYFTLKSKLAVAQTQADLKSCYVTADVNGVDDAFGFIVWTNDGYVDFLEGYTMALDSTVGMNFFDLQFQLRSAPSSGSDR